MLEESPAYVNWKMVFIRADRKKKIAAIWVKRLILPICSNVSLHLFSVAQTRILGQRTDKQSFCVVYSPVKSLLPDTTGLYTT